MDAGRGKYARGAAYCVHFCRRRKNSTQDDPTYTPRLHDAGWIDFALALPSDPLCEGCFHRMPELDSPTARAFHEIFKRCEDDTVIGFSGVAGFDWRTVYADMGLLGVPHTSFLLAKEYFRLADSLRQQHAKALQKAETVGDSKGVKRGH